MVRRSFGVRKSFQANDEERRLRPTGPADSPGDPQGGHESSSTMVSANNKYGAHIDILTKKWSHICGEETSAIEAAFGALIMLHTFETEGYRERQTSIRDSRAVRAGRRDICQGQATATLVL